MEKDVSPVVLAETEWRACISKSPWEEHLVGRVVSGEAVQKPDLLDSYPTLLSSSCQFTESGVDFGEDEAGERTSLPLYVQIPSSPNKKLIRINSAKGLR